MQTLLQYAIQGIWVYLEMLCLTVFAGTWLGMRWEKRKIWLLFGGFWLLRMACSWACGNRYLGWALTLVLTAAWLCIQYRGAWRQRIAVLAACALVWVIDGAVHFIFSLLLQVPFRDPAWQSVIRCAVITAAKLLSLTVAYLIRRFRMPGISRFVAGHGLFLALLFPCISLILIVVVFYLFWEGDGSAAGVVLTCGILAGADVVVLYLIHMGTLERKDETELTLLHKQMELQTQSILSLERSYRAQRKAAHEFRHHLQTLRDLLDREQVAAARQYIVRLQETHSTRVLCVNSRHPIIDAILNQKYQAASERSVDVQMRVNDLSGTTVDTEALVVILTNLLDNAIEACERLRENRQICCSILLQEQLFISVSNTALPVKIESQTVPTSKMPREEHGYGLPGVCSILDRLGAEYTFAYEDGWFRFVAEIPIA